MSSLFNCKSLSINYEKLYIKLLEYKHFYILLLLTPGWGGGGMHEERLEGSIPKGKKTAIIPNQKI